jgi:hypothetical protein
MRPVLISQRVIVIVFLIMRDSSTCCIINCSVLYWIISHQYIERVNYFLQIFCILIEGKKDEN